jgi:UDP-GlcNAc:undecaprenyl-phosphate GlcNAc-1-phosphate transferase
MTGEGAGLTGFAVAGLVTFAATPLAIWAARRTRFYDHPREYRKHKAATPFLGGAAVTIGVLAAAGLVGGFAGALAIVLACAVGMWALGTLDDRVAVPPRWRLLASTIAAIVLTLAGIGWQTDAGATTDAVLTVLWVVGLMNAFNLMDNMDGACATVGCVSAAGIGVLAAIHGEAALAGLGFALAGACVGFLPWNLTGPAKIFLGDGGSMVVGFLVAALTMATANRLSGGDGRLLCAGLLVGVPILDTTLVVVSRLRRRVPLSTGGRDHLTYRMLLALPSPRLVAAALAGIQAILGALAIVGEGVGIVGLVVFASTAVTLGALIVLVLDTPQWRPEGIAVRAPRATRQTSRTSSFIDSA